MLSVLQFASYILARRQDPITVIRLQRLCYYSKAWSLVWDDDPIFPEEFVALPIGPTCLELREALKGKFKVDRRDLPWVAGTYISREVEETTSSVLEGYQHLPTYQLTSLVKSEEPYKTAMAVAKGTTITRESMRKFYLSEYSREAGIEV